MAKGGGNQTVTTNALDPQASRFRDDAYNAARRAAGLPEVAADPYASPRTALQNMLQNPNLPPAVRRALEGKLAALPPAPAPAGGPSPESQAQQEAYKNAINLGMTGQQAFAGDPAALQRFINPDLENVIAKSRLGYELAQKGALNNVADRFTQARAFGGSRQAIASGQAVADVARSQAQNEAGLRYQAIQDAYGRAGQMMNLGMNAMDPRLRALLAASGMPYGTVTTEPYNRGGGVTGALGGAVSGYAATGTPWGAGAGAAAGSGIFG